MKALLNPHLARVRRLLARSTTVARAPVRIRDQLHGIVVEHLGHDIDMTRNGELWILRQLAPGCDSFMDVGANVGDWTSSFLAIAPHAKGWLLEPSRTASARLEARFASLPRIHIHRVAASDHVGTVTFFEEPNAGHTSSVIPGISRSPTGREVETITIDKLFADEGIASLGYLKIDAEGHDLHVLRGARCTLGARLIGAVQFEYNRPWQQAGSTLAEAIQLLHDRDYETFLLKGPRLYRLPYDIYGEFFHYSNFVALPRHRVRRLAHMIGHAI